MDALRASGPTEEKPYRFRLLESLRDQLGSASGPAPIESLDRLGAVLFGPLSGSLKETVFLLPTAMLNGLPVDAFRVNGRYLAERRLLIHANSLASATRLNSLPADYRYSVFLAGNPQAGQDLFSYGVSTSTELANVRDQFVGSGLHMVQGVALHLDEFNDERFSQASLVHLAMPGRVDLAVPERSRLLLSGTREDPSAEFLTAVDIRRFSLSAELAVLTGTAFAERPSSGFASLLGLVDDLHSAGVNLVVATLWPAGDRETARFVADFYSELAVQGDVPAALYSARKKRIESGDTQEAWWPRLHSFAIGLDGSPDQGIAQISEPGRVSSFLSGRMRAIRQSEKYIEKSPEGSISGKKKISHRRRSFTRKAPGVGADARHHQTTP